MTFSEIDISTLNGRGRRRLREWQELSALSNDDPTISIEPIKLNSSGVPVEYIVTFALASIIGVEGDFEPGNLAAINRPRFGRGFSMKIILPDGYPSIDAPAIFRFTPDNNGANMPWHPNIAYYGDFAGRVCLNPKDTASSLASGCKRAADYLRYDLYHADLTAPYPEDLRVAAWVREQGEPRGWIYFNQSDFD